jgi:TrmH family RNA methyltransferase
MVIQPLDSLDNKLLRQVKRLADSHHARAKTRLTVIEGGHLLEEALACGAIPQTVVYSPKWVANEEGRALVALASGRGARQVYVTDRIVAALSALETPPGILAVVPWPREWRLDEVAAQRGDRLLLAVAYEVQDPGNLGALVRVALAAGCDALAYAAGTVEPYSPKVLRASAGTVFRLPVVRVEDAWWEVLRRHGIVVRMAVVHGGAPYAALDWTRPVAVVLGNEARGLPAPLATFGEAVSIPMSPAANSLNVSTAASVLLFHAAWQRAQAGHEWRPPLQRSAVGVDHYP